MLVEFLLEIFAELFAELILLWMMLIEWDLFVDFEIFGFQGQHFFGIQWKKYSLVALLSYNNLERQSLLYAIWYVDKRRHKKDLVTVRVKEEDRNTLRYVV